MKTVMKAEPALVWRTRPSLKLRRNWTAGAASDPNVTVAIIHGVPPVPLVPELTVNGADSCSPWLVETVTM